MSAPGKIVAPARPHRLYGDLLVHGFEIEEAHLLEAPLSICDRNETLVLIVNLRGLGFIRQESRRVIYRSGTGGLCFAGRLAVPIQLEKGATSPSVLVVRWSRSYLLGILGHSISTLTGPLREWIHAQPRSASLTKPTPLDASTLSICRALHRPPMDSNAADLWFRSQSTEFLALWLFPKRARPRDEGSRRGDAVERAVQYLEKKFALPWTLPELAREVGCSPFHLSRIFVAEKGMTIKQYLRELRLRHARDLFQSGDHTVTKVGLAVGYRSLSHFSMAFTRRWGCTPESLLKTDARMRA
jgi:AraC-like DNA-binding protein